MKRVALTGGIATGKSHVRAEFERLGVPTIDADERSLVTQRRQAHSALLPSSRASAPTIVNENGVARSAQAWRDRVQRPCCAPRSRTDHSSHGSRQDFSSMGVRGDSLALASLGHAVAAMTVAT